ncbi:MAG: DUF3098 domain-containing protein [Cryomorphaceae bacterium]|nr:DUF3098 domain-containing protein [Cryomorphaceae bacterium]
MSNQNPDNTFVFGKKNYIIVLIGLVLIFFGYLLMSGGGSDDPNVFNPEIFNFQRIRLAPTLIILGFIVQLFAIFSPANSEDA